MTQEAELTPVNPTVGLNCDVDFLHSSGGRNPRARGSCQACAATPDSLDAR